jgi:HEAT repeat protein
VLSLLNTATDDSVRRRIVSGIAGWPEAACVPVLIDLTRSHANLAVRKEAASALSRSKDQRAIAYFESVLR